MHLTRPRSSVAVLLATLLVVSAAFFWTPAAGASIAVGTDLAGVDTVDLIARAGADPTADDDMFVTHVAGEVALDPASPAGADATAPIIDANASTLLAQIAYERTDAICSYLVAENVADLVEMDGGVHKAVVYEKLGLAEMAQLFAFTTWDDLYAGFYTLAESSPAFMTAYRASWNAVDEEIGDEVKSLIDHVQGLSGVPYVYERPVGDWTGDVVVLLATRESGYAFATLFSQLDTYHMVATTYLVRLQDTGDWASFVTSLLPFDSVTPDSPYPAFEGTTVGEKRIDPLPDNGIPSGAAKTLGPGTDDSGASDGASATRPS